MDKHGTIIHRNLKDKYMEVMDNTLEDIEKGNKSGKKGELSKTYNGLSYIIMGVVRPDRDGRSEYHVCFYLMN